MLRRIWQAIVRWFQRWFGTGKRRSLTEKPSRVEPPKPLEDSDREYLFMQLLEGVAHGWQQSRVLKFLADLENRTTETEWLAWLHRFGERLLAAPALNHELAVRMLQLREVGCGELGAVAGEIGSQLLSREEPEPSVRLTPISLPLQPPMEIPEALETQSVTLDELLEMLQQDPNLVQQLSQLLQIDTGDPQIIVEALLNQANAANPETMDKAEAWFNLGVQQHLAGDFAAAIASYDRSLDINPHITALWSNRGVALTSLERYDEAIASFERVLEMQPNDCIAWNNRGQALFSSGRHSEAIASFDRALEIDPDFQEAQNNRDEVLADLE